MIRYEDGKQVGLLMQPTNQTGIVTLHTLTDTHTVFYSREP